MTGWLVNPFLAGLDLLSSKPVLSAQKMPVTENVSLVNNALDMDSLFLGSAPKL